MVSTVVAALLIAVFARLGYWQLDRAAEKKQMLAESARAGDKAPLDTLLKIDVERLRYRQFQLRGNFDYSRQFLLDNQVYNGQPGYSVLTPFYPLVEDTSILVNRGWVRQDGNRANKPGIGNPGDNRSVTISGLLVVPSKGFTLGESIDATENNWPLVIQYLDYKTIESKLDRMPVVNAVLVLAATEPQSYVYNWQPVANGPEKHYGYAFQWFAMMFAVMTIFVYLNFIKKDE